MTVLSATDRMMVRASATRAVLEKTDRILGQSTVRVNINADGGRLAPAYTDGETIVISADVKPVNTALKNGFTPKTMMLMTALNYHELAHCIFMPRINTPFVGDVRKRGYFNAYNILQDQSDETRFVKLYEPARYYFTALVSSYMMQDQQFLEGNYVLTSGRLFLPPSIRKKFRDNFIKPELIGDIDRLVAEYKTLVYPEDQTAMLRVLKDFTDLLAEVHHSPPGTPHDSVTQGKPDRNKTTQAQGEQEFVDEGDEGEGQGEGKDENPEGEAEGEANSSGDAGGDEEEDGDSGDSAEDGDSDGKSKPEQPSNQTPPPSVKERAKRKKELKETLEDALEEAIHEVEQELNDRIDSIRDQEGNYEVNVDTESYVKQPVTAEHNRIVQSCTDEFRRVEMQHAPGWHRQQRHGKLDPRRYAAALQGSDQVFRRWYEGVNDALDFEVVFLMDRSGSMHTLMTTASESLWVLHRTFDECDGVITTLGFDSETSLLAQRYTKADRANIPIFDARGSTYVSNALAEARRILETSQKALKLCVVVSDGGFHDHDEAQRLVSSFGNSIAFVGINLDVSRWDAVKNVVHTATIQRPAELVEVVKNLALRLSEERLTRKGIA